MFTTGMSQAQTLSSIQAKLQAFRDAAIEIQKLYKWTSGLAAADLEGAPLSFNTTDAPTILSAVADANAAAQVLFTGQAPSTYPQVTGNPYPFAAAMTQVIGPS